MIAAPAPMLISLKNVGANVAALARIGLKAFPIILPYPEIFVPTFPSPYITAEPMSLNGAVNFPIAPDIGDANFDN